VLKRIAEVLGVNGHSIQSADVPCGPPPFQIRDLIDRATPEAEILLCCAQIPISHDRAEYMARLLQGNVDWPRLVQMAAVHRLTAVLYRAIPESSIGFVPEDVIEHLREKSQPLASLFLANELRKLLKLFEEHAIPVIGYKGPILGVSLYGDLALRGFGDIDIVVRRQDVVRARDLLLSRGYQPDSQLTGKEDREYLESNHACTLRHKDSKVAVDLHWRVTDLHFAFRIEEENLWSRLDVVNLGGVRVNSFSPENLLLILCVHGAVHAWQRMIWICDVAQLLRAKPMDWEFVEHEARRLGVQRILLLGLWLVHRLLDADVPADLLRQASDNTEVRHLAGMVIQRALGKPQPSEGVFQKIFRWQTLERSEDKMRYSVYLMRHFTAVNYRDVDVLAVPGSLRFVHYLLRPFRLARSYGRQISRHLLSS
jgi:hypothetical protein